MFPVPVSPPKLAPAPSSAVALSCHPQSEPGSALLVMHWGGRRPGGGQGAVCWLCFAVVCFLGAVWRAFPSPLRVPQKCEIACLHETPKETKWKRKGLSRHCRCWDLVQGHKAVLGNKPGSETEPFREVMIFFCWITQLFDQNCPFAHKRDQNIFFLRYKDQRAESSCKANQVLWIPHSQSEGQDTFLKPATISL